MLFSMIQSNYVTLILCILFVVFIICDRSFERRIEAAYAFGILIVFVLICVDNLELYEATKPSPTFARYLYSAIGYSLRPLSAIIIIFIMYRNRTKRKHPLLVMMGMFLFSINAVCCFLSIRYHFVFGYQQTNEFYRGPLGFLPFITGGVYVLMMIFATFVSIKARLVSETLVIFLIAALSFMGTFMESILKFDGMLNASCVVSFYFYYLYMHLSVYSRDQLTNDLNRRVFFRDVERLKPEETILIGADLNFLKKINDESGHAAGDRALRTFSEIVKKNLCCGCTLYRMGGDEFCIICKRMTFNHAQEMMQKIEQKMSSTPYSFAYGLAVYHKMDDIDAVLNVADQEMYDMKVKMKALRKE